MKNSIYACDTLVGFENHSGETYIRSEGDEVSECKFLAEVINGYGNNLTEKNEGVLYKNVFGTYLHGSLYLKIHI